MQKKFATVFKTQSWWLLALLFLIACSEMRFEPDSWWSLRAGQDFFAGRDVFHDSWTWRAEGNFWPNHEVLWEVITYSLYKIGGGSYFLPLMLAAACLVTPFFFTQVGEKAEADHRWQKITLLLILSIPYFYFFAQVRAFTASLALFSLTLWLIRREHFRYLPLVIFLWANLHGAFIVGCVALFVAFIMKALTYVRTRTPEAKRASVELLLAGALSFLLSFINPLGWRLWEYVLMAPLKATGQVAEWLPLTAFPSQLIAATLIFLGVLFGLALTRPKATWETTVSVVMFLVMSLLAVIASRNFMFMAVASLPLISLLVGQESREKLLSSPMVARGQQAVAALLLMGAFLVSVQGAAVKSYVFSPEALAAYRSCPGKQWNDYSSGGALVWFAPDRKAFQDNRYDYFDQEMVENLAFFSGMDWKRYMDDLDISCMFIKKTEISYPVVAADESGVWTKTFEDKVYSQWTRTER